MKFYPYKKEEPENVFRGDINIHNSLLQLICCSIEPLCLAYPINVGCSWLLNIRVAAN